jgi:hypothetical protein
MFCFRKEVKSPDDKASKVPTKNEAPKEPAKDTSKLAAPTQRSRHRSPTKILKRLLSPQRTVAAVAKQVEKKSMSPTKKSTKAASPVKQVVKSPSPVKQVVTSDGKRDVQ